MSDYEFHFDFVSPNSYLAHKVLPAIEFRHGIEFEYVPVSIRGQFELTNNKPTPVQIAGVKNKSEYMMLEIERFCLKHGIVGYRRPTPFPFDSTPYLAASVVAGSLGFGRDYIDCVYTGVYERGVVMDAETAHEQLIGERDWPTDQLLSAGTNANVQSILARNLEASVGRGTFGSPSFFVGTELFFGKDRFELIEEEIERSLRRD